MHKDLTRQIANLISVVLAISVNILASALPLNGQNTGEISDRFQVFFVPAGYVFAIWGVIYVGWIALASYQMMPSQKDNPRLRRLGYLFALSGVANAAWLFCWHYNQFGLSVLVMLILLGLLIAGYLRLDVNRTPVTTGERWCVDIPFSVYLGWITVATVANITDLLYLTGWDGFGVAPQLWAVIMLGAASLIGLGMALTRRDTAYLLVLVWSFAGIGIKQAAAPLVANAAWASTVFAVLLAVYSAWNPRRRPG